MREDKRDMTSIWYEVFPVTIVSQQAMLIRSQQSEKDAAWMIAERTQLHPSDRVVQHLTTFFNDAFAPDHMIVHLIFTQFRRGGEYGGHPIDLRTRRDSYTVR